MNPVRFAPAPRPRAPPIGPSHRAASLALTQAWDPHPIPPPFRGREERAARAALHLVAVRRGLLHPRASRRCAIARPGAGLPLKGGEPAPDLIRGRLKAPGGGLDART